MRTFLLNTLILLGIGEILCGAFILPNDFIAGITCFGVGIYVVFLGRRLKKE